MCAVITRFSVGIPDNLAALKLEPVDSNSLPNFVFENINETKIKQTIAGINIIGKALGPHIGPKQISASDLLRQKSIPAGLVVKAAVAPVKVTYINVTKPSRAKSIAKVTIKAFT